MNVRDGLSVTFTGSGAGVDMDTLRINGLANMNVNGQANRFASIFSVSGNTLALNENVIVDSLTANDLKGYASYSVEGDNEPFNYGCSGTAQITIKLDKTSVKLSYALTNPTVSCNQVSGNTVSGDIKDTTANAVVIKNKYTPASVSLSATKKLDGYAYTGEQFTFKLTGLPARYIEGV